VGKFDGVLLASDFDDTLYSSDFTVSGENRAALEYFTQAGGRFLVATGRAHRTFAPYVGLAPINAPCVLSNGASVYDFQADRALHTTHLPSRALSDLTQLAAEFPRLAVETYFGDDIYFYRPNLVSQRHMERVKSPYTVCPTLEEIPRPWVKAILEEDYPVLREVQRYVLERWGADYECILSNRYLLELTCKGSHKGGMVLWVANYLGIQSDHIYCVGDNQNDLPMLAVSAIPFAPSNCAREVKKWGARIVGSCDESCLAQIVEILDGLYP
jgi:Cof subfamily protein (haloacid dehalogenase superfamily)